MAANTLPDRAGVPTLLRRTIPRLGVGALLDDQVPCTLLIAPNGHGKTSAVGWWVAHRARPDEVVLWVDLTHVSTVEQLVVRLAELATTRHLPGSEAGAALARALQATREVVLVLDDLPPGRDDLLAEALELAVRHPGVRLIVCGTERPDLALIGARVDHQLIDYQQLRFSEPESARLLAVHDVVLSERAFQHLVGLTEGVPSWTHVAALMLSLQDLSGSRKELPPSFLTRWGEAIRRELEFRHSHEELGWLAAVGSLSRLDEAIVVRLTGEAGLGHLRTWLNTGLLVPEESTFGEECRRHPLLALALAQWAGSGTYLTPEFKQRRDVLGRELVTEARARGDLLTAFREALLLDDTELLVGLAHESWLNMLYDNDLARQVFARIPERTYAEHQDLRRARDWYRLWTGRGAVNQATSSPDPLEWYSDQESQQVLLGMMFEVIGHRAAGRLAESDRLGRRLRQVARELAAADLETGTPSLVPIAVMHTLVTKQLTDGWVEALPVLLHLNRSGLEDVSGFNDRNVEGALGHLLALSGDMQAARYWGEREERHPPQGWWIERRLATQGRLARIWVAMEELDPAGVEEYLPDLRRQRHDDELWPHIVEAQLTYELLWGDPEVGLADLREIRRHFEKRIVPGTYAALVLTRIEIDLRSSLGHAAAVAVLLEDLPDGHPWAITRRARLALLTEEFEEVLERRLPAGRRTARDRLELDLAQTAALWGLGRVSETQDRARRLAAILRRSGMNVPLATLPVPHREALAELSPDFAAHLETVRDRLPVLTSHRVELVELSARERAVLECLAAGLSRGEAAQRLFVSINTIKSQTRTLYRKLGAADRDGALSRARVLGLI